MKALSCALALVLALPVGAPLAQGPSSQATTYTIVLMSPELALRAAQAAMLACRQAGFQVSVAVVDRTGQAQVLLRDRLAGIHTADAATDKAWTAASFKIGTTALAKATMATTDAAGIRHIPRALAVGGGLPIEANGSLLGAIGISGGSSGAADDACARSGLAAVADDLNF